ncbi:MAG: hypothetical protein LZF61_07325 [Nitrosomonas sp.]|nr:MAG: hypothetical protein LZF61_07325 [Nitrosomonas sp.]
MRIVLLGLFLMILIPAIADTDPEMLRLEKNLALVQQESQSTYQQFLMIQELRRNEVSEAPTITAPNVSPEKSIPIPKYEDFVQRRQEKEERIKQYTADLDTLYARYKELEAEKQAIVEQMNALESKPEE